MTCPFQTSDGKLCVRIEGCGIPQLLIHADGLTLTFFHNNSATFVYVEDAIKWHERNGTLPHEARILRLLRHALATFKKTGKVDSVNVLGYRKDL